MPDANRIDRRQFAGTLAATSGAVAAALGAASGFAADDKPAVDPNAESKSKEPNEREALPPPPEELLLLNYLMRRYPSEHYDEVAMRGIYGDLRGDLARSRALSEFPLKNSDEPSFVFRVYRAAE